MNDATRIQWKRLIAEGMAIVVSILLAFSIDAWWNDLQERKDEAVILTTLLVEFRDIAGNIDDINDYHTAILASAYRLAELSEKASEVLDEEELIALVDDMM
jgi:hypothetical protein